MIFPLFPVSTVDRVFSTHNIHVYFYFIFFFSPFFILLFYNKVERMLYSPRHCWPLIAISSSLFFHFHFILYFFVDKDENLRTESFCGVWGEMEHITNLNGPRYREMVKWKKQRKKKTSIKNVMMYNKGCCSGIE